MILSSFYVLQDRTLGIDGGQVLGVIEGYCAITVQHIVHLLFLFTLSPFFYFLFGYNVYGRS